MKTLNLVKYNKFKKHQLQSNLEQLYKEYGMRFNIKYKRDTIPIKMYKNYIHKQYYFTIQYYLVKRTSNLKPFLLQFYLKSDNRKNDCYIVNISKIGNLSGTLIMKFILSLLTKIGVKTVYIIDGTTVDCGNDKMDLSLQKLLTQGKSFYQRFGFKYKVSTQHSPYKFKIFNDTELESCLGNKISQFKKIKVETLINIYKNMLDLITLIIKSNSYHKVDIAYFDNDKSDDVIYEMDKFKKEKCLNIVCNITQILPILLKNSNQYLHQILGTYFTQNCKKYIIIVNNIIYDNLLFIKYNKTKIMFPNKNLYQLIDYIRHLELYKPLY